MKTPEGDTDKTEYKGFISTFKIINKTTHNELILYQEDKIKAIKYVGLIWEWVKLLRNFYSITGSPKTIISKKLAECELENVTWYREYRITDIILLRGDL